MATLPYEVKWSPKFLTHKVQIFGLGLASIVNMTVCGSNTSSYPDRLDHLEHGYDDDEHSNHLPELIEAKFGPAQMAQQLPRRIDLSQPRTKVRIVDEGSLQADRVKEPPINSLMAS